MVGSIVNSSSEVTEMYDWDFSTEAAMKRSMETIKNRKARAIIMSTTTARSMSQLRKTIKCAVEQHKRGIYFVLETIINDELERKEAIQELVNQEGICFSKEY